MTQTVILIIINLSIKVMIGLLIEVLYVRFVSLKLK